jgi:hypothetical protein
VGLGLPVNYKRVRPAHAPLACRACYRRLPRAGRDIEGGVRAGGFPVGDPELAMVIVAGAALSLGQLPHDHPERDDAETTDRVTEDLLRMLGLPPDEAHEICQRPLPT